MDSQSFRSLSSLLLLPPPKPGLESTLAPSAPPGLDEQSRRRETRDEGESHAPDDEHYCARDGVDNMGQWKRSSNEVTTPPTNSKICPDELAAAYSSERRGGYFGSSPNRSGISYRKTPEKKEHNVAVKSKSDTSTCRTSTIRATEFGGEQSSIPQLISSGSSNQKIFMVGTTKCYSRTLIPPTMYHNTSTDLWVVTINNNNITNSINYASNTNNNSIKAFSFRTEREARASAYANAPPIMLAFDQWKECMLCGTRFTMFKRPRHCRNCGICICSNFGCCARWPKTMIPETFNIKNEKTVKVCLSCDALAKRFRHALLQGQYNTAVDLYLTGNVNLRAPFAFKGGTEISFPIHCAIEGMSEMLVRWLVDVQHCPIHVISTGNTKRVGIMSVAGIKSLASGNEKRHEFVPTLKTSMGRSIIDIAMKTQHVGILRYLINEKNVSVYEVEDLELALGAVEALSKASTSLDTSQEPQAIDVNKSDNGSNGADARKSTTENVEVASSGNVIDTSPKKARTRSHCSPLVEKSYGEQIAGLYGAIGGYHDNIDSDDEEEANDSSDDDNSVCTTIPDVCIICCQKDVNCVATPCGHQICCLACSRQRLTCPKCNSKCHFIEIFQP
ncbi:hypothetical protein ACHAXH_008414 [Discostella pseudostelligera]